MSGPGPQSTTFRDMSDAISPAWLKGPVGTRFRYSMSVLWDAIADGAAYAVRFRFPDLAANDALPWIGSDRQIDRGAAESVAFYRSRLITWLDLWRIAGTPPAMLIAELAVCLPAAPMVRLVTNTGLYYTYAAGAPYPMPATSTQAAPPFNAVTPTPPTKVTSANWNWDGLDAPFYGARAWWRAWLVLYPDAALVPPPTKRWGAFWWGDGTCFGWGGTATQASEFTAAAAKWRPAHCWVPWILVAYDATYFDPALSFGSTKLPDGHWGHYGKIVPDATWGRVRVPARPSCSVVSFIDGAGNNGPLP